MATITRGKDLPATNCTRNDFYEMLEDSTISGIATGDIANSAVTTPKIADAPNGVTTAKINDLAVTTAKIAAGAVTEAKTSGIPIIKFVAPTTLFSESTDPSASGSYVSKNARTILGLSAGPTALIVACVLRQNGDTATNLTFRALSNEYGVAQIHDDAAAASGIMDLTTTAIAPVNANGTIEVRGVWQSGGFARAIIIGYFT